MTVARRDLVSPYIAYMASAGIDPTVRRRVFICESATDAIVDKKVVECAGDKIIDFGNDACAAPLATKRSSQTNV